MWFNYSSVCYYSSSYFKKSVSETALWCADWLYDIQQPIALSHLSNVNALLQMEVLANHCTWFLFQLMLHQNWEIETEYACAYVCVYVYACVYVWKKEGKRRERQRENWYLHYYYPLVVIRKGKPRNWWRLIAVTT